MVQTSDFSNPQILLNIRKSPKLEHQFSSNKPTQYLRIARVNFWQQHGIGSST